MGNTALSQKCHRTRFSGQQITEPGTEQAKTIGARLAGEGGFTFVETMVTVAMLVILLSLGLVGLIRYRDYLKITELDNAARDIYMAAQNRAVLMKNSRRLDTLLETGAADGAKDLTLSADTGYSNGGSRYISHRSGVAAGGALVELIPAGTIDPALWKGQFYVVYNPESGFVTDVFYAEAETIPAIEKAFSLELTEGGREARMKNKPMVGYYGSAAAGEINTKVLPTPGVQVLIENGEELKLKVTYTLPADLPDGVTVKAEPTFELKYQGTTIELPESAPRFTSEGSFDNVAAGNTVTYTWVLDSLESTKQFKGLGLVDLGDDFTVTAGLRLSAAGYIDSAYYAEATDNSLFAKGTTYKNGTGIAQIANLRHLQNLHTAHSAVGTGVVKASQTADIDCRGKNASAVVTTPPYNFIPITNASLESYDGKKKVIRDLHVSYGSAAGLFGQVTNENGLTIRQVRMIGADVVCTSEGGATKLAYAGCLVGYVGKQCTVDDVEIVNAAVSANGDAGGLIGEIYASCEIKQCRVYWEDPVRLVDGSNYQYQIKGGGFAGGLVGSARGVLTIEKSYAASMVEGGNGAGGLVGQLNSNTGLENVAITCSYADCYLKANKDCGGLIGRTTVSVTMTDCYSAGFIEPCSNPAGLVASKGDRISVTAAGGVYSVVRIERPNGLFEAKVDVDGARYFSTAEQAKEALTGLGGSFCENPQETYVYNLRYRKSNPADGSLKLETPYPYPGLKYTVTGDSGETVYLPHYGDWAVMKEKPLTGLAYYESYQSGETVTYGAEGIFANEEKLNGSLTDNAVIIEDGYALMIEIEKKEETGEGGETGEDGETPEEYEVRYNAESWTLSKAEGEWRWTKNGSVESEKSDAFEISQMSDEGNSEKYTLVPLPDEIVTGAWSGINADSDFYQTLRFDNTDYSFNPHFAKTAKLKPDSVLPEPVSEENAVSIRTPRHFWHLSEIQYVETNNEVSVSKQFYPGKGLYYRQELDLDYAGYNGYDDILKPEEGSLAFEQLSIGCGTDTDDRAVFRGTYDGGCHTIRNVLFSKGGLGKRAGLFGSSSGVLKNIVYEMNLKGQLTLNLPAPTGTANPSAGMLLGYNRSGGTVENCAVYGVNVKVISPGSQYSGGLVGENAGTIQNCSAEVVHLQAESGKATGTVYAGGLVGRLNQGTVAACYAVGKVSACRNNGANTTGTGYAAGLIGSCSKGNIINSYAAVHLEATVHSEGKNNKRGLFYATATSTPVVINSFWLSGNFSYCGELYETGSYSSGGSSIPADTLTGLIEDGSLWAGSVWAKTGPFPYLSGVKDAAHNPVHYGSWPEQVKTDP